MFAKGPGWPEVGKKFPCVRHVAQVRAPAYTADGNRARSMSKLDVRVGAVEAVFCFFVTWTADGGSSEVCSIGSVDARSD